MGWTLAVVAVLILSVVATFRAMYIQRVNERGVISGFFLSCLAGGILGGMSLVLLGIIYLVVH